ncbi:IPT/TIG domain-containing protein [Hymenobacter humi]|uniref:IPT/TIG domain-containing protein n=1 Tax=Hymenobacter humi TaxID=1411620 RepID=A0ABW2U3W7_9BACT
MGTGGSITLSTCSATTTFDSKLFVFTGSCGNYTCVDGNDDDASCGSNGTASAVTFNSIAGASYLVFVTGYQDESGPFTISATCAPPAPVLAALSPASGPVGTVVTLTGTDFTGATSLTLNGVSISGYTVVNAGTLTFSVPAGASTGNIVVTTPGGSSNPQAFTVTTVTAATNAARSEFSVWPNPVAGKGTLHIKLALPAAKASLTLRTVLGQPGEHARLQRQCHGVDHGGAGSRHLPAHRAGGRPRPEHPARGGRVKLS